MWTDKQIAIIRNPSNNRVGTTILPDNAQYQYRVEIRSETSTRLYVVAQNKKTGVFGCSCPSWCTRRTCKHLTTMLPILEAVVKAAPKRVA